METQAPRIGPLAALPGWGRKPAPPPAPIIPAGRKQAERSGQPCPAGISGNTGQTYALAHAAGYDRRSLQPDHNGSRGCSTARPLLNHWLAMLSRNSRIGMILFLLYLTLYGGFVLINALAPQWMELRPVAGLNLAILYGFGLIIAALLMAVLYGVLCDSQEESP
jgi:uncharacterized membrane protein (DUF485 family)